MILFIQYILNMSENISLETVFLCPLVVANGSSVELAVLFYRKQSLSVFTHFFAFLSGA